MGENTEQETGFCEPLRMRSAEAWGPLATRQG